MNEKQKMRASAVLEKIKKEFLANVNVEGSPFEFESNLQFFVIYTFYDAHKISPDFAINSSPLTTSKSFYLEL
jgi:hypothetical protein